MFVYAHKRAVIALPWLSGSSFCFAYLPSMILAVFFLRVDRLARLLRIYSTVHIAHNVYMTDAFECRDVVDVAIMSNTHI